MRDVQRLVVVVAVAVLVVSRLDGQRSSSTAIGRIGPHLGYNFDAQALDLGFQATLPLTPQVELYPTFDYYFVSPGSLWALNVDMKIRPRTPRHELYVGGGLDFLHSSSVGRSSEDVNLSLIGGWEGRRSPVAPYVEGRLLLGNGSAFQVAGGISFDLH